MTTEFVHEVGPAAERPSCLRYETWVATSGGRIRGKQRKAENASPGEEDEQSEADEDDLSKEVVSLKYFQTSNAEQVQKLYGLWQKQPLAIHYYLNRFIFPDHTRSQQVKFSASGQEVGGDMLIGKRVGFSGTPSDLLP